MSEDEDMADQIKRFTRPTCRTVSKDAEAALKAVAARHGLTFVRKSGSFSDSEFTIRVCFQTVADDGVPASFKRNAALLGLDPDCYGKEFSSGRGRYRITGINMRRPKYPVSAERVCDGKGFKFPATVVKMALVRVA